MSTEVRIVRTKEGEMNRSKNVVLNLPTFGFIVSTRAALGVGIGLLLSERLPPERRRAVGATLIGIGAASTVPAAIAVLRSARRHAIAEPSAQARRTFVAANRKGVIQRINEAFGENNLEKVLAFCTEDFTWTMVGDTTVRGKDPIRRWMASMNPQPPQFTIHSTVAEGDFVITRGDMTMQENEDGPKIPYTFCDIYRFEGDKVAELTAFVIRTGKAGTGDRAASDSSQMATAWQD
jgi:predicted SnoaL-like aldol condensation-catalyzing enzyme